MNQRSYRWLRSLHLYLGLLISPFVLIYAVSSIALNHAVMPWGGDRVPAEPAREVLFGPVGEPDSVVLANAVRRRLDLHGEIGFVNRDEDSQTLSFPLEQPGRETTVSLDLASGIATIQSRETGFWDAIAYLHKKPGPHNVALQGNWVVMKGWAWLADIFVYLILFSTMSGVYLWTVLRAERKAGLLFLGGGAVSFVLAIAAIIA